MYRISVLGMVLLLVMVAIFIGCSGKTTVKEEMIDTTQRKVEEKKESTTEQPAGEEASKEEQKETTEQESGEESKSGSGYDDGSRPMPTPRPMMPDDDGRTERGGGKAAREQYLRDNLTYPGSEPVQDPGLPESPGFTGKTLLSKDPAGTVAQWYMNKFPEKASMNKMGGPGEQYRVTITDKENGYSTDILIHKIDNNNPTRIMISLRDM